MDKGPGAGGYALNPSAPAFLELQASYVKKSCKDTAIAQPRCIFVEQFRDGDVALDRAIAEGAVSQFVQAGIAYCAFRQVEISKEVGHTGEERLQRDEFLFERERERNRDRARARQGHR